MIPTTAISRSRGVRCPFSADDKPDVPLARNTRESRSRQDAGQELCIPISINKAEGGTNRRERGRSYPRDP